MMSLLLGWGRGRLAGLSSSDPLRRGSSYALSASTPALAEAVSGRGRRKTVDRLVGDQLDAGVEEVQARGRLRLLARLRKVDDRFDALGGHQQRELHGGGADDAGLHVLHARTAAVDGD